mgnify:FL=1
MSFFRSSLWTFADKFLQTRHHGVHVTAPRSRLLEDLQVVRVRVARFLQRCSRSLSRHAHRHRTSQGPSRPSGVSSRSVFSTPTNGEGLSEILNLLGSTRSSSILTLFLDALTCGGPSGLPRPIELHAHDPIRYIGDMLAWIHQMMAGEREFLESLFGIKEDGRRVGSVRVWQKEGEEGEERVLRKLLDRDLEGCGRPLKVRCFGRGGRAKTELIRRRRSECSRRSRARRAASWPTESRLSFTFIGSRWSGQSVRKLSCRLCLPSTFSPPSQSLR